LLETVPYQKAEGMHRPTTGPVWPVTGHATAAPLAGIGGALAMGIPVLGRQAEGGAGAGGLGSAGRDGVRLVHPRHQIVTKLDANSYTTEMAGLKYKLAHKRADKTTWSASDRAQRRRLVQILREPLRQDELHGPPWIDREPANVV